MNEKTVLLVEDEKKIQQFNRDLLEEAGFTVQMALTLAAAREFLAQGITDVMVLDIGMPDGNGLDFLRELRRTSNLPVLMLTGFGDSEDVVKGFEHGCDDYLPKPYTFEVLHARLQRLLHRAEQLPEMVTRGPLTLNILAKEAFLSGEDLLLQPKIFTLLQYFVQNEGRLLETETIYEKVWGQPLIGDSQALFSAVSRLRKKLEGSGYTITKVYGNGYRFEEEA